MDTIQTLLTRFLARKAVPRHLAEGQPQDDEVAALLAAIRACAPQDEAAIAAWWPAFETQLDLLCGRSWPTAREIRDAAQAMAPSSSGRILEPLTTDAAEEITAQRMRAGEAVGEAWLYGRLACGLIARGLVERETMERYRRAAFWQRVYLYGEAAAQQWEEEARARHDAARLLWRSRDDRRARHDVQPYMPPSARTTCGT